MDNFCLRWAHWNCWCFFVVVCIGSFCTIIPPHRWSPAAENTQLLYRSNNRYILGSLSSSGRWSRSRLWDHHWRSSCTTDWHRYCSTYISIGLSCSYRHHSDCNMCLWFGCHLHSFSLLWCILHSKFVNSHWIGNNHRTMLWRLRSHRSIKMYWQLHIWTDKVWQGAGESG